MSLPLPFNFPTRGFDTQMPGTFRQQTHSPKLKDSGLTPSKFLRHLRPEYYSDSAPKTDYALDQATLEYHLDTITHRNQTHDFEIFCRKLCERAICPNLRPATGPEGGGDSKADTETYAVSLEISQLTYIGEPSAGSERWAFAFSANARWKQKAQRDVEGIIATGRPYRRIICVTSRFARAKARSELEDLLSTKYDVQVEIHDRTWIVKQIIEHNRKDLAFNYLGVGNEVTNTRHQGPSDYSRQQQLNDIEASLADPRRFHGMPTQRVTEALLAAKLARAIELPRIEVDGRFERARRLASTDGTHRQQLEVAYEALLTAFWWYDDFDFLNTSYDGFEASLLPGEHVRNVELLSTLAQLLVNSVLHGHLSQAEAKLIERTGRLQARLEDLAQQQSMPNASLHASTLLCLWKVNMAVIQNDISVLPTIWRKFSEIIELARPMAEYDADALIKTIHVVGQVAQDDKHYNALVEEAASFIAQRKSESEAARVLLRRANQLSFDQHFEMIRLLGRAVPRLSKRECGEDLFEALKLLSLAYRSAGLLWASRAICLIALGRIASDAEEEGHIPTDALPVVELWAWLAVELRHIPDLLATMQVLLALSNTLPLVDDGRARLYDEIHNIDLLCAGQLLKASASDLEKLTSLPDAFDRSPLSFSRAALLYSLGYEGKLREEGTVPEDDSPEAVRTLFSRLASQPVFQQLSGPIICNSEQGQILETKVLGLTIRTLCSGSETSILVGEVLLSAFEVFLATAPDLQIAPHTEVFEIEIKEEGVQDEPSLQVDLERMRADYFWPANQSPAEFDYQEATVRSLMQVTGTVLASTSYCPDLQAAVRRLYEAERAPDRITTITIAPNSCHRFMGRSVSRLSDYTCTSDQDYPERQKPQLLEMGQQQRETDGGENSKRNHRTTEVSSVIDVHLWDRAGWQGAGFFLYEASSVPVFALLFANRASAAQIFTRWRERFGAQDRDERINLSIIRALPDAPLSHYEVLVTSSPDVVVSERADNFVVYTGRHLEVTAETTRNLDSFMNAFEKAGKYLFAPAVMDESTVQPMMNVAILKQKLSVRIYQEIGPNDIEVMAFPEKARKRADDS